MMLIEQTSVPDAALPVDAFKAHLRLGTGFAESQVQDEVLASFLRSAMAAIEARTGKVLLVRPFSWTLTLWRDTTAQGLPVAPVVEISRVAIEARNGTTTEVDPARYWLERDNHRPRLRAAGAGLPAIPRGGAAQVEFEAGYASDWNGLPADLRQAVLLLAAHYYEYRMETSLTGGLMPFGVSSLIERFKSIRLGGGA